MGPTKRYKTGAIVGTYPKPMLVLLFDQGGLDIVPSVTAPRSSLQMDVTAEEIVPCKPGDLATQLAKPDQPKVVSVNYFQDRKNPLETDLRAAVPDETMFINFVRDVGVLFDKKHALPWKTVVLDSVTGLQDLVFSFIASKNPGMLADARQWAFQIGQKVKNACAALTCLDAHVAIIMHSEFNKDDLTGMVTELPSVYSGLRNEIGCYFSQFFYAVLQNNIPMVSTTDYQYVKGLGMRWPVGLPAISPPDFKSLYGRELGL